MHRLGDKVFHWTHYNEGLTVKAMEIHINTHTNTYISIRTVRVVHNGAYTHVYVMDASRQYSQKQLTNPHIQNYTCHSHLEDANLNFDCVVTMINFHNGLVLMLPVTMKVTSSGFAPSYASS